MALARRTASRLVGRTASPPAPGRTLRRRRGDDRAARRAAAWAPRSSRRRAHPRRRCLRATVAMPSRCGVRRGSPRTRCELRVADQRTAVEVGERGPGLQRGEALAQAREHLFVARSLAPAAGCRREHVCPAFCTIALTSAGNAASRSASANTTCGDLPPSSSVTGQCRFAASAATQRAGGRRAGERNVRDARMLDERGARLAPEPRDDVDRALGQARLRRQVRATRSSDRHASSAGLTTQALPAASAPPTERPKICSG